MRLIYLYRADVHCESCGEKLREKLTAEGKAPRDVANESTYDSDTFPKTDSAQFSGEWDTPQHCGTCGVYLALPLTYEGIAYAVDAIAGAVAKGQRTDCLDAWADDLRAYGGLSGDKRQTLDAYRKLPAPAAATPAAKAGR